MEDLAWALANGFVPIILAIAAACIGVRLIVVGIE